METYRTLVSLTATIVFEKVYGLKTSGEPARMPRDTASFLHPAPSSPAAAFKWDGQKADRSLSAARVPPQHSCQGDPRKNN